MHPTHPQLTMIGHLDIWTTTVDGHITQSRDFDDALIEIGRAVITGGKHITLQDDARTVLNVELAVKDVEEKA